MITNSCSTSSFEREDVGSSITIIFPLNGVGIIHQEIVLVPYLSVAQNLFLGREIKTKYGTVDKEEMNKRATEMIASLGVKIEHGNQLVGICLACLSGSHVASVPDNRYPVGNSKQLFHPVVI